MKTAIFLAVCLFAFAAVAAGRPELGSVGDRFVRQLKQEAHHAEGYDIVDCYPKEKDCPKGYYCVYYPNQKCKIETECKTVNEKKCAKYGVYFEVYDEHDGYSEENVKERKCVEYKEVPVEVCNDKEVCFDFVCAKLAEGYD